EQLAAVEGIADLRIVEMHGGSEYSTAPGSGYDKVPNPFLGDIEDEDYSLRSDVPHQWDIDIRHSAIDSGADMVLVHHPHIIQGIELYNGKVIAHSLGNFAFDLNYSECMPSMVFYADAYPDGFSNYRVRPVYIDDYIPKPATGQLALYILDYLAMKSTELGTALAVDKQTLTAHVVCDPADFYQVQNHWSTTQNFVSRDEGYQYTAPVKLPRFGSVAALNMAEPDAQSEHSLGSELLWFGNFEDEGSSLWNIGEELPETFDGQRCARLNANSGSSTMPEKMKLYDNTKRYTLHGWIKTRDAAAANITVSFYLSRTAYSPVYSVDVTADLAGTNDWNFFSRDMFLPTNAWYWDMKLSFSGSGTSAAAWFDNVGLIEWTSWQSCSELQQIPFPNNYYWVQSRSLDCAKSLTVHLTEIAYSFLMPRSRSESKPEPIAIAVSPNPFNPSSRISFNLSEPAQTKLDIFNLKGQKVRTLLHQDLHKGDHIITWDGRDQRGNAVASGIYFLRLNSGNRQGVAKAILMK
ncbi:MAG TPA: CapA family protein, partial [Candidatus Cloacimonadota bacterium]|nr:CapA family protein [Candidatus Cloacimonadota bacterium]